MPSSTSCPLTSLQVSQVYESIELSRLVELAPFSTTTDLEKVVVETATSNNIQVGLGVSDILCDPFYLDLL